MDFLFFGVCVCVCDVYMFLWKEASLDLYGPCLLKYVQKLSKVSKAGLNFKIVEMCFYRGVQTFVSWVCVF